MSGTNWSIIISEIMDAKPPKGKKAYTYEMIEGKTGIGKSTLSRLSTGTYFKLDYDDGVKLIAMRDELKAKGKLQK